MIGSLEICVLAGDFIGSQQWSRDEVSRAHDLLGAETDRIGVWSCGHCCYTRNRGNGWQMVIHRPALDLRAVLTLRAALRAEGKTFDTRIAMARGNGAVPGPDLNAAHGPAFFDAGLALDNMVSSRTLIHTEGGALGAATMLGDALSRDWTPAQARVLRPMLAPVPPTHAEVAKALGISRSAVSQALAAARFDHFSHALDALESGW